MSETTTFEETSRPGNDFSRKFRQTWEAEAQRWHSYRHTTSDSAIWDCLGNAVDCQMITFKLFAGGPIGTGSPVAVLDSPRRPS